MDFACTLIQHSTAPPSQPQNVTMLNVGTTWICISWEGPLVVQDELDTPISYYIITANTITEGAPILTANVTADVIFYNVTGLLPGTMYKLTVVAVSTFEGGDVTVKSQPSDCILGTTIAIFGEMEPVLLILTFLDKYRFTLLLLKQLVPNLSKFHAN